MKLINYLSERLWKGHLILQAQKPKQKYCCDFMEEQLNYICDQHGSLCPDQILKIVNSNIRLQTYDGYDFIYYQCNYCPWCGGKI